MAVVIANICVPGNMFVQMCVYSQLLLCGQCVDLSCNELTEINLPENLPPKLQELDLTGNPRLNLDHKTLEQLKYVLLFSARFFIIIFNALPRDIYIIVLVHTFCSRVILSPLLRLIRLLSTLFFVTSAIFAAFVSILLQPFHQMRHLVGPLCGVMVTQRHRVSRTSEFNSVSDENTAAS